VRWPRSAERGTTLADNDGLKAAYAAHGPELYRFALRLVGDDGAAQDVVQETFLRAWRSAARYDPQRASLRVWLFAIARNAAVDFGRRAANAPGRRVLAAPADLEVLAVSHPEPDPSEGLMRGWLVEEALRRISAAHRRAIVETYLRQRPYAEVAAEEGVLVSTLRSRVFYALKALRLVLEEMGVEP
jgi:RNA polymerase sigma-70 factor, ECF subfamily